MRHGMERVGRLGRFLNPSPTLPQALLSFELRVEPAGIPLHVVHRPGPPHQPSSKSSTQWRDPAILKKVSPKRFDDPSELTVTKKRLEIGPSLPRQYVIPSVAREYDARAGGKEAAQFKIREQKRFMARLGQMQVFRIPTRKRLRGAHGMNFPGDTQVLRRPRRVSRFLIFEQRPQVNGIGAKRLPGCTLFCDACRLRRNAGGIQPSAHKNAGRPWRQPFTHRLFQQAAKLLDVIRTLEPQGLLHRNGRVTAYRHVPVRELQEMSLWQSSNIAERRTFPVLAKTLQEKISDECRINCR